MATNKCKPMPQLAAEQVEKFWIRVDKRGHDECWPWTSYCFTSGYGRFDLWDAVEKAQQSFKASRVAYFLSTGVDPGPLFVCHKCDNPPCCNPAHLFTGTCKDNSDDMLSKSRAATGERNGSKKYPERLARGNDNWMVAHPEFSQGENNPSAKLTEADVAEILRLKAARVLTKEIAAAFGIHTSTVFNIWNGNLWRHLNLPLSRRNAQPILKGRTSSPGDSGAAIG